MYILGLHTDGELIKGALIQSKGKRLVIEALETCTEDPDSLEDFKKKNYQKKRLFRECDPWYRLF
jgi:hypothetical protein